MEVPVLATFLQPAPQEESHRYGEDGESGTEDRCGGVNFQQMKP